MKKDGRYSAASLSVLPTFESPRPEPPEQLPEEGKQVWRATVAAFKSDWFQGCGPLLQCYCQEVVIAHQIAGALSQCNVDDPRFGGLVRLHVAVSANLGLLATRLRMTPQSTRDRRNVKHLSLARKPWQTADESEEPPVAS